MAALLAHVWRSLPASTLMPRRPCLRRDQGWGPTSVPAMEGLASMGRLGPRSRGGAAPVRLSAGGASTPPSRL
jgi:hypothetical protein